MAVNKRKTWLEFEAQSLMDLRKMLFRENLTMNDFFRYVVDLVITNDDRMTTLMKEAREHKADKAFYAKSDDKIDAEMLYDLIKKERAEEGSN